MRLPHWKLPANPPIWLVVAATLGLHAALGGAMSCTENSRARSFGGTATYELKGEKLLNVTWKEGGSLWMLTRPLRPGEALETYRFGENSSWGVVQGLVVIKELPAEGSAGK